MGFVVVHGGAGGGGEAQRTGVLDALHAAIAALRGGEDALHAACAAVATMEGSGLFNAGRGAVRTREGDVELDAAVMRGSDRAAGAVASVRGIRHPIALAQRVLEAGEAVLLTGDGAARVATDLGMEPPPADWFVTPQATAFGTVGAVAVDDMGVCAAATSTGGVRDQRQGRVGDSPLIGAGTYADRFCAISATGDGEMFIRAVFAHSVARAHEQGLPLRDAARQALSDVSALGGSGGCVAVTASGQFAMEHTTDVMPAGFATTEGEVHAQLASSSE